MSSLRNAVARRPHRERAQPQERQRLGLLEKHKDYSARAKDYNKKKTQLRNLRQKASERNDDEFYFGMMSRRGPGSRLTSGKSWTGKVAGDRGNRSMDLDVARLLKTQDKGYVRTMAQVARKEVGRLEEEVVLVGGVEHYDDDEEEEEWDDDSDDETPRRGGRARQPRKIVFADNEDDRQLALAEHDSSRRKPEAAEEEEEDGTSPGKEEQLTRLKSQLAHARKKLRILTEAERRLEEQTAKMAKTATSGGTTRRGKKIMVRTRKR